MSKNIRKCDCGSDAHVIHDRIDASFSVHCKKGGSCVIGERGITRNEAIMSWNRKLGLHKAKLVAPEKPPMEPVKETPLVEPEATPLKKKPFWSFKQDAEDDAS